MPELYQAPTAALVMRCTIPWEPATPGREVAQHTVAAEDRPGATVTIDTPDGPTEIALPAGITEGSVVLIEYNHDDDDAASASSVEYTVPMDKSAGDMVFVSTRAGFKDLVLPAGAGPGLVLIIDYSDGVAKIVAPDKVEVDQDDIRPSMSYTVKP